MKKVEFVVSKKPARAPRSKFPDSAVNVDGSVCMLIPPGSSSSLRDLVLACDLDDKPISYCILVSALIQIAHSMFHGEQVASHG